jgi:YjbE family integral membrane protein
MTLLQVALLNIALSGDNVSVIALAVRNLPEETARKASILGISAAVVLRIIFACLITIIMGISWLPIKLVGGLILIKITWDLMNTKEEEAADESEENRNFWRAVTSIMIADMTMSLDNVLAIAGAANGNIWIIIFGIATSIPIIFFGAQFIADLMNKHRIVIFIGAAILMYTSVSMITEDHLVSRFLPHFAALSISIISAVGVMIYGQYVIKNENVLLKGSGSGTVMEITATKEDIRVFRSRFHVA